MPSNLPDPPGREQAVLNAIAPLCRRTEAGPVRPGTSGTDQLLVGDADPQAAESLPLVLDLDDLDLADLAGRGDVRAAVRLLIEADYVDDPHVFHIRRNQVGSGADDVREVERLLPRQHPYVDPAPGADLGVAGSFDRVPEAFRQLRQVEVHPGAKWLHVAAGHQRTVIAEQVAMTLN